MSKNDGGPVEIDKILKNEETRTNLMVKNVPCRYTYAEIKEDFQKNHKNRFNDLRLPMDKNQPEKTGRGYCFINFRHVLFVLDFYNDRKNYHWPKYASDKTIDINYATYSTEQMGELHH
jgi:RNA recognition motif-containing protein